jgi:ribosome recycling factor
MKTEQPAAAPSGPVFASVKEVEASLKTRMEKALSDLQHEMASIRTGRATLSLLDHIRVDYYGTPTPLNQVAKVILLDARTIAVTPFEKKLIPTIEKGIREADLGLNPSTSGDTIRLPMPALTEERRKELIKVVKHEAENARVAVRNLRRDAIQHLKDALKKHEVSENDERRATDEVQKMTDKHVAEIDKLVADKEKELMAI